jgi:urea transport system permease protein
LALFQLNDDLRASILDQIKVLGNDYDLNFKLFAWTLAAVMSGIAGALYVPQVGIINPSEMSPAQSIEIAIWTAVGGRASLIAPIIGAFAVNAAKSWFTVAFPQLWLFFLGAIFIGVTLFLPRGIAGLWQKILERARSS